MTMNQDVYIWEATQGWDMRTIADGICTKPEEIIVDQMEIEGQDVMEEVKRAVREIIDFSPTAHKASIMIEGEERNIIIRCQSYGNITIDFNTEYDPTAWVSVNFTNAGLSRDDMNGILRKILYTRLAGLHDEVEIVRFIRDLGGAEELLSMRLKKNMMPYRRCSASLPLV